MSNNTLSAGDAIRAFLKTYGLDEKIVEAKVVSICKEMLKAMGNDPYEKIKFYGGHLTLFIKNAALKNELSYQKSIIIEEINKELKQNIVKSVSIR